MCVGNIPATPHSLHDWISPLHSDEMQRNRLRLLLDVANEQMIGDRKHTGIVGYPIGESHYVWQEKNKKDS
jgi:hypothetical protein